MQFLKTLLLVVIAVVIAIFCVSNWSDVTINLWSGLRLDTKLPLLIVIAYLAGLLPAWMWHRATRWSLSRKVDSLERALSQAQTPQVPPNVASDVLPPSAAPIAAPPGVA